MMMRFPVYTECTQAFHCCDLLALGPELPWVALFSVASYKTWIYLSFFFFFPGNETELGFSPLLGLCSLPAYVD